MITDACSPNVFRALSDEQGSTDVVMVGLVVFVLMARLPKGSFTANTTGLGTGLHSVNPRHAISSAGISWLLDCLHSSRLVSSKLKTISHEEEQQSLKIFQNNFL